MLRGCLRVDVLGISPPSVTTDDGEMLEWCSVRVHCYCPRSTTHVQRHSFVDASSTEKVSYMCRACVQRLSSDGRPKWARSQGALVVPVLTLLCAGVALMYGHVVSQKVHVHLADSFYDLERSQELVVFFSPALVFSCSSC